MCNTWLQASSSTPMLCGIIIFFFLASVAQQQAMQDVVQKSMTTVIEMMGGQIQACVQEAIQGVANSSVSGQTESTAPPDSSGRGEIRTATDV